MQIRLPYRLRKLRDSGKKRLFVIPYLFTFANACLGLLAVLYAWDDYYISASYCIMLAAVADTFDGRLARALGSCSSLGMELDSLCDAISFCFAPAIVLYGMYLYQGGILGIIVAGIYLCAGLFRLAKFNNTCCQQKYFFIGMSTPVSAIFFALLITHESWISSSWLNVIYKPYVFLVLVLLFAYFMVSRIPFPTFKSRLRSNGQTFYTGLAMIIAGSIALWVHNPVALSVIVAYVLSALIYHIRHPQES